ncbi:transglycosylase SLT domain-containing protein [Aromatoleum anaerobium]|uniref:Transglycosylase SLT domain-containing protein n=1 Tax=Aromatoleum anaerobium TaxID=182180 RepID=A0ABX1PJ42_9RHOO|nr:transglycosylase SLT domain-containing protein [Aromatoleum anaerobium]MCK0505548.1 transglycosylase SLT domain-containing protein [Aromatoleum anaerobium]
MKRRKLRNDRCRAALLFVLAAGTVAPAYAVERKEQGPTGAKLAIAAHARYLVEQGVAHEHGEGVPRNPARAVAHYCEAARLGDAEAMYALGWMYANGRGTRRNDAYAGTLFAMAAARGDVQARRMLRFTGGPSGQAPPCLNAASTVALDDHEWNPETHIRSLSAERQRIARMIIELAPTYQISPRFALAIAVAESRLDAGAVSPKNAMGVMQLIPDTAARFNVRDPFDPRENIKGGLAYLRWLLAYFRGDIALAAAGYNAGEGAVDRYRGVPPYPETRAYVARILNFVARREHPFDSRIARPSAVMPAGQPASEGASDT